VSELSKNSFTKAEVDKLLFQIKLEYDSRLREQKNRIFELVGEVKQFKELNERLKKRDELISKALLSAVEKAKELEITAKKKTENEINRLQTFINKCEKYLSDIMLNYPIDNNIKKFDEFTDKMKGAFMPESSIVGQNNLKEELAISKEFNPKEKIDKYIEKENCFNMDDVLNPKGDLNLEDLCRQLGLMD
jgi:hypothetical protein